MPQPHNHNEAEQAYHRSGSIDWRHDIYQAVKRPTAVGFRNRTVYEGPADDILNIYTFKRVKGPWQFGDTTIMIDGVICLDTGTVMAVYFSNHSGERRDNMPNWALKQAVQDVHNKRSYYDGT